MEGTVAAARINETLMQKCVSGTESLTQSRRSSFHSSPWKFWFCSTKKSDFWTSLVAEWLRIHLPMQGTQVRALVQEDPTGCGATKPVRHNY